MIFRLAIYLRIGFIVGILLTTACANNPTLAPPTKIASIVPPPTRAATSLPPTNTPIATATLLPTRQPSEDEFPKDAFWKELQSREFKLVSGALTRVHDGSIYSAYLLTDTKLKSVMMSNGEVSPSTETGPGICQLAFYKWDGYDYEIVRALGEKDEPWWCEAIDWDSPEYRPDEQAQSALGLQGYWSDINRNALPEFAVVYYYCLWACHGVQGIETHFYEIQDGGTVVDIVADLPGVVLPWGFLHSEDPVVISVYAPVVWGYHYEQIELYLLYQWDGAKYVDVTREYSKGYIEQAQQAAARIQKSYGQALERPDLGSLLEILVLYNAAALPRQDGLDTFLDVTNPVHWPGTDKVTTCWLQVTRAYAQMDFEQGVPFRTNPTWVGAFPEDPGVSLSDKTTDIDTARFDVSACK